MVLPTVTSKKIVMICPLCESNSFSFSVESHLYITLAISVKLFQFWSVVILYKTNMLSFSYIGSKES